MIRRTNGDVKFSVFSRTRWRQKNELPPISNVRRQQKKRIKTSHFAAVAIFWHYGQIKTFSRHDFILHFFSVSERGFWRRRPELRTWPWPAGSAPTGGTWLCFSRTIYSPICSLIQKGYDFSGVELNALTLSFQPRPGFSMFLSSFLSIQAFEFFCNIL